MKKIYTLAIMLLSAFAVSAQSIDLEVTQIKPANSTTVTVGVSFDYEVIVKIKAGDSLKAGDTLWYVWSNSSTVYGRTGKTRMVGDTMQIKTTLTYSSAVNGTRNFCTAVFATAKGTGNEIPDPDTVNNVNCKSITIQGGSWPSSVPNIADNNGKISKEVLTFGPNPASSEIFFDYTAGSATELNARVIDITGREVSVHNYGKTYLGQKGFKLDISMLNSGIYFVELTQDGRRAIGRLVKE